MTAQWSNVGQQTVLPGHSTNSVKVCPLKVQVPLGWAEPPPQPAAIKQPANISAIRMSRMVRPLTAARKWVRLTTAPFREPLVGAKRPEQMLGLARPTRDATPPNLQYGPCREGRLRHCCSFTARSIARNSLYFPPWPRMT